MLAGSLEYKTCYTQNGEVQRVSLKLGRRLRFLVGKPGLDGHSNGAEQIAARATDAGMDVVYDGIRLTPAEIVEAAKSGVHCIGLSILSGSHVALTEEVLKLLRAAGLEHVPLIVGGIVPPADGERLRAAGVAAVYTPKDFEINSVLHEIVKEVENRLDAEATTSPGARDTTPHPTPVARVDCRRNT